MCCYPREKVKGGKRFKDSRQREYRFTSNSVKISQEPIPTSVSNVKVILHCLRLILFLYNRRFLYVSLRFYTTAANTIPPSLEPKSTNPFFFCFYCPKSLFFQINETKPKTGTQAKPEKIHTHKVLFVIFLFIIKKRSVTKLLLLILSFGGGGG